MAGKLKAALEKPDSSDERTACELNASGAGGWRTGRSYREYPESMLILNKASGTVPDARFAPTVGMIRLGKFVALHWGVLARDSERSSRASMLLPTSAEALAWDSASSAWLGAASGAS